MNPRTALRPLALLVLLILAPAGRLPAASEDAPADAPEPTLEETEAPAEPERLFEELLVVGTAAEARRVPGSAHVITAEELERQGHDDVHRILRRVPGLNIQEEEGYGLRPNIGIRGTGVERSQKITLLEDGILIAPAPYAAPSAYYSPTAGRMEGFEVRKGSSAIRQGPYTNGGAINYVSRSIPGALAGRLELAAGGEGLARGRAWVGDSGERFGWLFETYQLSTDGFKRLDGGGDTGVELEDYVGKVRFTSRPRSKVFQALEFKLGRTEQLGQETYLGLTADDFDRTPYRRYAGSAGDAIDTEHSQLQASYYASPGARFDLTATVYRNEFFRNWRKLEKVGGRGVAGVLADPAGAPELLAILRGEADSEPGSLSVRNNRRDYYSEGVQVVVGLNLGERHRLDLGARYHRDEEDRFQEEDGLQMLAGRRVLSAVGAPGSQANRIAAAEALALFAHDTFTLGRWTLSPGVRVESIDLSRLDFGKSDPERGGASLARRANELTEVIPGLGVGYRLGDRSNLFFGVHRGFSPPSPSSTREVEAEESLNYELGWRFAGTAANAELVAFYNDYDNLLGSDTVSGGGDGSGDQFNGGAAELAGLEAGFDLDLARRLPTSLRLPLRLAYTYTESEFGSSFASDFADWAPAVERGDELPYVPPHQLFAGLSVEAKRWAAHLDASYQGEMRTRAGRGAIAADERIESRLLFDLRAELTLSGGWKVWAQLLNATDEVYVAARRPAGLRPGRPRAALFGVTYDF